MKHLSFLLFLSLAFGLKSADAAQTGATMPDFSGATWFNSPPLTLEDLDDRAVLVEVFRTW